MRIVVVLVLILVAVMVGPSLLRGPPGEDPGGRGRGGGDRAVPVEVAAVEVAPIQETVVLTGSLEPRAEFVVAPKVGGRLESLLVEAGDTVTRGELVARLEDEEYAQQLAQARAEVDVARAQAEASAILQEYAKRELGRLQSLADRQLVADTELDAARGKLEGLRAEGTVAAAVLAQKEAAMRAAQVRLDYTQVHAVWEDEPLERIVGERFAEEGALMVSGTPLVSILDIATLDAVIFVIERDYARVRVGQHASIATDAYPGESFEGVVARVAPLLQETSRQARVEVRVDNPRRQLRPGMFVRVGLELDRREAATVVPREAVVQRKDRDAVFLVNPETGTVSLVPVEVGIVAGDRSEITSPALSGDVVTIGHHLLSDGAPVTVVPRRGTP